MRLTATTRCTVSACLPFLSRILWIDHKLLFRVPFTLHKCPLTKCLLVPFFPLFLVNSINYKKKPVLELAKRLLFIGMHTCECRRLAYCTSQRCVHET